LEAVEDQIEGDDWSIIWEEEGVDKHGCEKDIFNSLCTCLGSDVSWLFLAERDTPEVLPIDPPFSGMGGGNETTSNGTSNLTGQGLQYPGFNFFSLPNTSFEEPPTVVNGTLNITLKSTGFFDPLDRVPNPPLDIYSNYSEEGYGYYLIQFTGPPRDQWFNEITNLSAVFHGYLPTYSYVIEIQNSQFGNISSKNFTRWLGNYHGGYKIGPSLQNMTQNETLIPVYVCVYEESDIDSVTEGLLSLGVNVTDNSTTSIVVTTNGTKITQIAGVEEVYWIELMLTNFSANLDVSAGVIDVRQQPNGRWTDDGDSLWNWYDGPWLNDEWFEGITGAGVVVAVVDTGLTDQGDFTNRIDAYYDYRDQGAQAFLEFEGHGTHVAGIVAGDGADDAMPGRRYVGVAPGSHLVIQKIQIGAAIPPFPGALRLTSDAVGQGASIQTNSWGVRTFWARQFAGQYTNMAMQYDQATIDANPQMTGNQPLLIIFAAGNDGHDGANPPNWVYDSIGPPSVSKNVLTVGASENLRPPGGRPLTNPPLGVFNTDDFADNANEIVYSSSKGPTDDLRIKPDVVAPGSLIISSRDVNFPNWCPPPHGWLIPGTDYGYCTGTSMAAPHVAGAAALITQYFRSYYGFDPSPALVKALLINGAEDMGYGYGQVDINPPFGVLDRFDADLDGDGVIETFNLPLLGSYIQGWGRVNIPNSVYSTQNRYLWFDDQQQYAIGFPAEGAFTVAGQTTDYSVVVDDTGLFKITLVWTDSPATAAAPGLINDLDLEVITPDQQDCYYGNDFDDATGDNSLSVVHDCSTTLPMFDSTNNVENVFINVPEAGRWTIRITARTIGQGPQNYALVVSGVRDEIDDFDYTDSPFNHGWWEYDDPGNGNADTVWDTGLQSRVLRTTTTVGTDYGIALTSVSGQHGSSLDYSGGFFTTKLKTTSDFYIYAQVMGENPAVTPQFMAWNIRFEPGGCQPTTYGLNYVLHCLGQKYDDGNWHTIWRDLNDDLFLSGYQYHHTIAFYIRGALRLDDLDLMDSNNMLLQTEPRRSFGYDPGPRFSADHSSLRLSEFRVFSTYGPQQNDQVNAQFLVQNTGSADIEVLYYFVVVRGPVGLRDFGYTGEYILNQDETLLVTGSRSLDVSTTWRFYPGYSYCPPAHPDCYGTPNQEWYVWWDASVYLDMDDWDRDGIDNEIEWRWSAADEWRRLDPWHYDTDSDGAIDSGENFPSKNVRLLFRIYEITLYEDGDSGSSGLIDMYYMFDVDVSHLQTDTYYDFIGAAQTRDMNLYYTADVDDTLTSVHLTLQLWDRDTGSHDHFDIAPDVSRNFEWDIDMTSPWLYHIPIGYDPPRASLELFADPGSTNPPLRYDRVDLNIGGCYF
jgi:hypothetical protein